MKKEDCFGSPLLTFNYPKKRFFGGGGGGAAWQTLTKMISSPILVMFSQGMQISSAFVPQKPVHAFTVNERTRPHSKSMHISLMYPSLRQSAVFITSLHANSSKVACFKNLTLPFLQNRLIFALLCGIIYFIFYRFYVTVYAYTFVFPPERSDIYGNYQPPV